MTTAPQRLLNLALIVFAPIPVFGALAILLSRIDRNDLASAALFELIAFIPIMILAGVNFILYKKWTLWHADSESASKKQVLMALIPTGIAIIYATSVSIFFWMDTKPLYLECEISKSKNKEYIGGFWMYRIKESCFRYCSTKDYLFFRGRGWLGGPYLGIRQWDDSTQSWTDPLPVTEYSNYGEELFNPDGGLLVYDDKFVIRGFPINSKRAIDAMDSDEEMRRQFGITPDQNRHREAFDHLTINRLTGKFIAHDGDEGVCTKSSAPITKTASSVNTKF